MDTGITKKGIPVRLCVAGAASNTSQVSDDFVDCGLIELVGKVEWVAIVALCACCCMCETEAVVKPLVVYISNLRCEKNIYCNFAK